MTRLKAAVAGAGVFGGYHAGKYASFDDVELVAIIDPLKEAAVSAGEKWACQAASSGDEIAHTLQNIDLLTIATPAPAHFALAKQALLAGVHVYCEKPLALEVNEAQELVRIALEKKRVLAVGHQERCVIEAMGLMAISEVPKRLEAVRFGTPSLRNLDVSVTLDLMIHDLDLIKALGAENLLKLDVTAKRRDAAPDDSIGADELEAHLSFDNGFEAIVSASRIAPSRERTMRIVYEEGEIFVDLLNRRFENTTPFMLHADFAESALGRDPLGLSVRRFIEAVKGEGVVLCTGQDGLNALELALKIDALSGL